MDRINRILQMAALTIALVAPWIYFVGYAHDWGYLDSFSIERQLFFKAPQEYFGIAYEVFLLFITNALSAISEELLILIFASIAIVIVSILSLIYWAKSKKLGQRIFHTSSSMSWSMQGKVTRRFLTSVATLGYLLSSIPVLLVGVVFYTILFVLLPPLVGYSKGLDRAKEVRESWNANVCKVNGPLVGCTQILENNKPIASGILIAASERSAAIYDGKVVLVYSLRNRDLRTILQ